MLKKVLLVVMVIYVMAMLASMAVLEIAGWTIFLLAMAINIQEVRAKRLTTREAFFKLGPDWVLLSLLVIVVLGFVINAAPDAPFKIVIGGARFIPLMYGMTYAIRWIGLREKIFAPFMILGGITAIHGIQEYFTAYDFIRHKPITRMIEGGDARATGFFGLPTTFGNAISMTLCFPAAMLFSGWRRKTWENYSILVSTVLLLIGLALSFTRAAWIAYIAALLVMAFYKGIRPMMITLVSIILVSVAFLAIKPDYRARVETIFDLHYHSNVGRLQMWQTNWWMVQDYPILGIGLNENERRGHEYNLAHGVTEEVHLGNAHDTYLQFLAGTGVLGLTAYLLFIGYYVWLTLKLLKIVPRAETWHRTFLYGALGAQVAMHIVGLMDCNFKSMQVQHQFIFILCSLSYLRFVYLTPEGQQGLIKA